MRVVPVWYGVQYWKKLHQIKERLEYIHYTCMLHLWKCTVQSWKWWRNAAITFFMIVHQMTSGIISTPKLEKVNPLWLQQSFKLHCWLYQSLELQTYDGIDQKVLHHIFWPICGCVLTSVKPYVWSIGWISNCACNRGNIWHWPHTKYLGLTNSNLAQQLLCQSLSSIEEKLSSNNSTYLYVLSSQYRQTDGHN